MTDRLAQVRPRVSAEDILATIRGGARTTEDIHRAIVRMHGATSHDAIRSRLRTMRWDGVVEFHQVGNRWSIVR